MSYDDEDELDCGVDIGERKPCIADEVPRLVNKPCSSSDGMAVYEHVDDDTGEIWFDAHCWSCKAIFSREEVKGTSLGAELYDGAEGREPLKPKPKDQPITPEDKKHLLKSTGHEGMGIRGIKDEFLKFYGHRTRIVDGRPVARYYPETCDNKVVGYKCRIFPKDFSRGKLGVTGKRNQFSGQVRFKGEGKYILIVGGEEDKVAAYQMFKEHYRSKGQDYEIPVVSSTVGEGTTHKQCAAQYDFLDNYEFIILGLDNDKAGNEAMLKCVENLPKTKVKIAKWSGKDPNNMLEKGMERDFINDFYRAKFVVSGGIKTSAEIDEEMLKELMLEKIGLPPFMHELEKKMCGGIPLGYILNIIADTGIGKTEYVNAIFLHWIFNAPYKVGVVSLELTAGQYGIAMLSKYIGKNLLRFNNPQDAIDYVNSPYVVGKRDELWTTEDGEARWSLLDERDGSVAGLQEQVERLIQQHGCKIIVIDVLSDLLEGLSNEEQGLHMKWQKNIIKRGVTLINVVHSRKPQSSKDGTVRKITEYDAYGSSTIVKSAGANLLLSRDKMAIDVIDQNTTLVEMSKCRWSGMTGEAGNWYYDGDTRRSYDYNDFFGDKGHLDDTPQGIVIDGTEVTEEEMASREAGDKQQVLEEFSISEGLEEAGLEPMDFNEDDVPFNIEE